MAVKADGPADVDRSTEKRGSAVGTPGLSGLDEEREASLADEGGASGATIESQDLDTPSRIAIFPSADARPLPRRTGFWFVAGALAAGIGALALKKRR